MQWKLHEDTRFSTGLIQYYSRQFLLPTYLTKILLSRGITNEDLYYSYAYPSLADLHDPFLFKEMRTVVYRIYRAIMNGERISIFGDYDADGMTSSALLYRALCNLKVVFQ